MSVTRVDAPHRCTRRRGLTLVELLVVVALLALVSTTAVTGLAQGRTGAADAAHAVAALQAMTRELAVTRGAEARLTVDLLSGAWEVTLDGPAGAVIDASGQIGVDEGVQLSSVQGHRLTGRWDPLGRGDAPPVAVSDGGREYGLVVDPWTGTGEVIRVR